MKDIEEKVMTQEEKAKRFDEVLAMAKECITYVPDNAVNQYLLDMFPELKESEDERIRKVLIGWFNRYKEEGTCGSETFNGIPTDNIIAWLEKQVPVDEDEIVKGIRRGVAISLMNHIDANSKGMCLSNMECEDIENAIVNEYWDKVYGYMKKKLEKQGEKAQGKTALEAWKDMRFEVYQQASGNRHEPNCSDDATKMFSLTDIDEIFEKIAEKQGEQKPFDYENANIQQKDFAPKETVKEAESNLTPLERKVKDILFSFHIKAADGISFDGTMAIVHNLITLCQQEQKHAEKKELKKIEQKFNIGDEIKTANEEPLTITKIDEKGYWSEDLFICGFDDTAKWEVVGQKTAWSEEDEREVAVLEAYIRSKDWSERHIDRALGIVYELVNKIKSIRPQTQWKPSEKQMNNNIQKKLREE